MEDRDEIEFTDEQGEGEATWERLPPEREFFSSPYDPPVRALVEDIQADELIVRPTFQRNQVWDRARQSRFVESILLNIPIPTLFFAEDEDKTKVVVDGQQRLLALQHFLENQYPLRGLEVLSLLNGKRFAELTDRQQRIIRNRTLRCQVISARSDSEIRFQVFERLNQGGMPLNAQEVRHCVYRGELNELLHELKAVPTWLTVFGREEPHNRLVDCELILRFFAIREALPGYAPPLKTLLNEFMRGHRHADTDEQADLRAAFLSAVDAVHAAFPEKPFRRYSLGENGPEYDKSLNRAVLDAQLIVMEGMDREWLKAHGQEVRTAYEELCLGDDRFQDAISRATADKSRLKYRLNTWVSTLADLGADIPVFETIPDDGEGPAEEGDGED